MPPPKPTLKDKASKIVVENGQIVKVSKDKDGIVTREVLTKTLDRLDRLLVGGLQLREQARDHPRPRTKTAANGKSVWTGDYIFENEWQSFRTKKDRSLELTSVFHECKPGRRKIAVKVVDIFGNDTMTIVEVNVGGKK